MLLSELCTVVKEAVMHGPDCRITGLEYDSRRISTGDVFFAVRGFNFDGHDFAAEAVEAGACAVVGERWLQLPKTVPQVVVGNCREAMGRMSAHFFGHPSRQVRVIGVTGTKGKTTTTYLIKSILEAAGYHVGLIGSIQNMIGNRILPAKRTTPEAIDLQRTLAEMVKAGCSHVVMEVSSHAVELMRTVGTEFDVGVFTNLARDHLDFHATFAEYRAAKVRFFSRLASADWNTKTGQVAVINIDDTSSSCFIENTAARVLTYGLSPAAAIHGSNVVLGADGVSYKISGINPEVSLNLSLRGQFNVYNSLAAFAVGTALGIEPGVAVAGLETVRGVPGRFEPVECGQDFAVIVDFAHTPESIENVLQAVDGITEGRRIIVFGCGGDRDKGKRPLMGQAAARYSDYVIITSDNPRSEDPVQICRDIEAGVAGEPNHPPYEVIVDRRQAIKRAVKMARAGDTVILAGKGHETYQEFDQRTIHFDDREEAKKALKERLGIGETDTC